MCYFLLVLLEILEHYVVIIVGLYFPSFGVECVSQGSQKV